MGTHPIFESDFDCLTDQIRNEFERVIWNQICHRRVKVGGGGGA